MPMRSPVSERDSNRSHLIPGLDRLEGLATVLPDDALLPALDRLSDVLRARGGNCRRAATPRAQTI